MDRRTRDLYEGGAREWIAARRPKHLEDGRLAAFVRRVRRGARVADLGCGPGWYAAALRDAGLRVVALDLAAAMLVEAGCRVAALPRVQADLAALPFRPASLDAAFGLNCYCHVPAAELPLALADLHAALKTGALLQISLPRLDTLVRDWRDIGGGEAEHRYGEGELPGRLFTAVTPARARALLEGAGFERIRVEKRQGDFWLYLTARRARTLPDLVRPGLRLLLCGLNPSLYSADRGLPFARPGNRLWPAARAAGLVERGFDARHALECGIGMTDLVKRASAGAGELKREEYAAGVARVEALVRLHRPAAICFVGLDGWRRAVDRRAQPGWLSGSFGGQPAYLMPSTSGRNARVPLAELAAHLRAAAK